MNKKRIVFIVNPISGTKGKQPLRENIAKLLDRSVFQSETQTTQYAGHAAVLAREASEQGADIVVAVGGDGTVNEVARSLIHTDTALGIIPCGSGNGLARHLQIPMDPKKAIEVINRNIVERLDYGTINGMPFFCTCGVGFDAFVSFKFANAGRRGLLTYLENTLREGLRYKPETYTIEDESGSVRYNAFLIACGNASQYGNNAYIAPQASMSDGLLDITVMEPFSTIEAPQIAIQLFNKTLDKNSHIKTFRAKKIRILRQAPGAVHCDGDPMMTGQNLDIESFAGGLKVVINPQVDHIEPTPNLLQIFSAHFDNLQGEILNQNRRLITLNKLLLRKLKKL